MDSNKENEKESIPNKFRKDTPHPFMKRYQHPSTPSTPYHSNFERVQQLPQQQSSVVTPSTDSLVHSSVSSVNTAIYKTPYYLTPRNNNNDNEYQTPYSSLKKDTSSQRLFALFTPDTDPQPNTTTNINTGKNVHSPPKLIPSISELKDITEKCLLVLSVHDIDTIESETHQKKPLVREWFRQHWFDGNEYIQKVVILRTVYSIFCRLSKEKRLQHDIVERFQKFWIGLVKFNENRVPHRKRKTIDTTNKYNINEVEQNEYSEITSDSTTLLFNSDY
ncbi:hypothetical protein PPL_01213 [Heterostelium album PN500]|uniref:Uncharacterized protein n=1 Tax=Heterostelium pallidum (strain ATCC 26659 / Pp 5 / PN500) TaxID=670386 RepID=D3AYF3_HETP5|nr:hypothetical protein PPL_01213 [Heterostelium album PN500]EFA85980.1 hypothetical protein PPL_01213 [Heterostelium album PN500]|eukprot:XP_020438086.1 hypothetical protein PPL_01213 [Heterostelium album PN500]